MPDQKAGSIREEIKDVAKNGKKDDKEAQRQKELVKKFFGPQKPSREEGYICTRCGQWIPCGC